MKNALRNILSYIPRRLPVGITEFTAWSAEIIAITGPLADPDSMRYVIATSVLHLPSTKAYVAPQYFIRTLIKGAANQVSSQIFMDIKVKQEEARKAAAQQPTPEVTAPEVTNGSATAQN